MTAAPESKNSALRPRRRRGAFAIALATLALVSGCGSAPPVRFHSLMPAEPPASSSSAPSATGTLTIQLLPIDLPAQVDQPQWVVRTADGSLAVLEQDRWVGPLREELRSALLERMATRHDIAEARSTAAPVVARVFVQLLRFDSVLGREAVLEGTWLIVPVAPAAASRRCTFVLREPAAAGTDAMAQAQRTAVAQLADNLGRALRDPTSPCR